MKPISHVGYLRREDRDFPNKSRLLFAVLWNGELSLFPCKDSSKTYTDPTNVDGVPEVIFVKGSVASMPFPPCPSRPGFFTLVGPRSIWQSNFIAPTKEDALVWMARLREFSSSSGKLLLRRNYSKVLLEDVASESMDECRSIIPTHTQSLSKWIRRARGSDPEWHDKATSKSCSPEKKLAQEKLACLQGQLKERKCLLRQLQDAEAQFASGNINFRPYRFASTAKTSFCLVPGNEATEVRPGDKITVLGLQRDFTWRCYVHRRARFILSCGSSGEIGYTVTTQTCVPNHSLKIRRDGSQDVVSVGAASETSESDGTVSINSKSIGENSSDHRVTTDIESTEPQLQRLLSMPLSVGTLDSFTTDNSLAISAKEVMVPLVGSIPSLDVLSFVSEDANKLLADAQLKKLEEEEPCCDSPTSSLRPSPKKKFTTMLRPTSSSASLLSSSGNRSSSCSPILRKLKSSQSLQSANTTLSPSVSVSMPNCSELGVVEIASPLPRSESNLRVGSADISKSLNDSHSFTSASANSDSSSEEESGRAARPPSRSYSFRKFIKRHRESLTKIVAEPPVSPPSPIIQNIVEGMETAFAYNVSAEDLPSNSSVCSHRDRQRTSSVMSSLSSETCQRQRKNSSLGPDCSDSNWEFDQLGIAVSPASILDSGQPKVVQFDWPTTGLHLTTLSLLRNHSNQDRSDVAIVSHLDEMCSACQTNIAPGDAILSINERNLDSCSANQVSGVEMFINT